MALKHLQLKYGALPGDWGCPITLLLAGNPYFGTFVSQYTSGPETASSGTVQRLQVSAALIVH